MNPFRLKYAKVRKNNENLGYINYNGKWCSSEIVLQDCLKEMIKLAKERAERERIEREEKEKQQRENSGGQTQEKAAGDEADE